MPTMHSYKLMIVYNHLKQNNWNRTHTALELDLSLRAVRNYVAEIRKLNITVPDKGDKIPAQKCRVSGCEYFMILNPEGKWECYACKYNQKHELLKKQREEENANNLSV